MTHSNSAIFTGTSPSKGQSPASANAGLTTSATSGTAPTDKSRSHR